jgi:peptide/nickel transport system substrate-binding protein
MPRAQLNEAQMRGEHHIGEVIWFYPDPSILTTLFHSVGLTTFNKARLSDPELDKMLEQAATTIDERQRADLYRKLQRTLSDMVATIPLVNQVTIVGVRKNVQNYQFNIVTFPVLYDVYLEK